MRISELMEAKSWDDVSKRKFTGPNVAPGHEEESPFGDLRKSTRQVGGKDIGDIHNNIKPDKKEESLGLVNQFVEMAKTKGYHPYDDSGHSNQPTIALRTNNDILIKIVLNAGIKPRSGGFKMYIGLPDFVKKDDNLKKEIIQEFEKGGLNPKITNGWLNVEVSSDVKQALFVDFWKAVDISESIEREGVGSRGSSAALVKAKMAEFEYYMGAASLIYVATRFGLKNLLPRGGSGESGGSTFDINDKLITVGITKAGHDQLQSGRNPYREHAVPCKLIVDSAIQMYQDDGAFGKGEIDFGEIEKVADMIERNLMIVLCGDEEAKKIDAKHKTTMPAGWNPTDGDPLARFTEFGIEVYPISGGQRLREEEI